MTHGHAHEEAEHASHHAHDPFDRRVAMSMVVIAAVLAAVKVLGHRTHNETLSYQIKAGVAHTQASNTFSFFQSKRQRMELAQLQAAQLELLVPLTVGGAAAAGKAQEKDSDEPLPDRKTTFDRLLKDLNDEKVPDAEAAAKKIVDDGEKRYRALLKRNFPKDKALQLVGLEMNIRRYRLEADAINARARDERKQAEKYQAASTHKHHQADYFDLGELGVELALVLSSVAILTKRPGYWLGGIAVGLIGLVCVAAGFFVH